MPVNTGDTRDDPWVGILEVGNGNPLQHSCLKNSMDRGVWQVTVMGLQRVGPDSD